MKENPYAVFCPECGKTLCYKCERYFDVTADGWDNSPGDRRKLSVLRRAYKKHLATYDHAYVGENDKSQYIGHIGPAGLRLSV